VAMALESIIEEIYKKGEEQAQKIKEEANKEAQKILAEAREEANEVLKKAREDAEKEAEGLRRQEISSLNLEMKRLLLDKQREILESVYGMVTQRIREMDVETKKKVLTSLMKENAEDGVVIYSNKDDEELVKSIIQELKISMEYGGNINCLGGIIIESSGRDIRINLTFDEMLKLLYEQKMSDVSKILFG
jgi:V/A-type H+-transporting ATPase subunit E